MHTTEGRITYSYTAVSGSEVYRYHLEFCPNTEGRITYTYTVVSDSEVNVSVKWDRSRASISTIFPTGGLMQGRTASRPISNTLPTGGLMVRLRLPDGAKIAGAVLGNGEVWKAIDASAEALVFTVVDLAKPGLIESLASIRVTTKSGTQLI
jgi:hypothetical protein